jgi:hypothetical protein
MVMKRADKHTHRLPDQSRRDANNAQAFAAIHSRTLRTPPRRIRFVPVLLALVCLPGRAGSHVRQRTVGAATPPELNLVLKPEFANGVVDSLDVQLTIGGPVVEAGGTLLRMPLVVASIPTARYDGDAVQGSDGAGKLPLVTKEEAPTSVGIYRRWLASRKTVGEVVVKFRAPMRTVSASTRPGPLFDLRSEGRGLDGAGLTFLALPDNHVTYRIRLHWALSGMPAGSRGVWSLGEGDASAVGPADLLANTYYAAGPMMSYPSDGQGRFAMYWLQPASFDTTLVARRIERLYAYMSKFAGDENSTYRVFIRKNPYHSGGGTALVKSFMFGYSDEPTPTVDSLQGLLAHEMVHNWLQLAGQHGEVSWYDEGAAQYYSLVLSFRAGLLTPAQFLEQLNSRAAGYYTSPLRSITLKQAEERYWHDPLASYLPYSRGFMYLAITNARILAKSDSRRSLDDLVHEIRELEARGQAYDNAVWVRLVTRKLGRQGTRDYDDMVAGKQLVPPRSAFAPCLRLEKVAEREFEPGFDTSALSDPKRVVRGLIPGSAAAVAGLRDGDQIVEVPSLQEIEDEPSKPISLPVSRGGQPMTLTYLPRGKLTVVYQWVRVAGVQASACKF